MRLSEKLLLRLSREPELEDYPTIKEEWNIDNALSILDRVFPEFENLIKEKEILDYGCGTGYQALALARNGAKYVLGLDTDKEALKKAEALSMTFDLTSQVEFASMIEDRYRGRFDLVISQNSMEHFEDPIKAIDDMKFVLNQNGSILITFGPPWFAPYGSHMHFFTRIPWVNIIFDEKTVMSVRSYFRDDGAIRYEEVEGGLNKMSVAKFERIIRNSGLKISYMKYECVKRINFLSRFPLLRELFINQISCILNK